jgi:transcriptional regulator with XRE-family HTH domain
MSNRYKDKELSGLAVTRGFMSSMERFGEKLHALRTQRGLSLRQLSQILGVGHSYVAKLERSEKLPNVVMVLKIARFFEVSTDLLLKDELELEG